MTSANDDGSFLQMAAKGYCLLYPRHLRRNLASRQPGGSRDPRVSFSSRMSTFSSHFQHNDCHTSQCLPLESVAL